MDHLEKSSEDSFQTGLAAFADLSHGAKIKT